MLKSIIEYRLSVTHNFKLSPGNKDQSLKVMFFKIQSTSRLPRLFIINACSWAQSQPYRISISSGWNMNLLLLISSPHTYYSCQNFKTVAFNMYKQVYFDLVNRQKGVKYEVLSSFWVTLSDQLTTTENFGDGGQTLILGEKKKKKKTTKKTERNKRWVPETNSLLSGFACKGNPAQVCINWWKSIFGI